MHNWLGLKVSKHWCFVPFDPPSLMSIECVCLEITVASSHQGFLANFRKKFCKIQKTFCIVILAFLRGLKRIFFYSDQIQNTKNLLIGQTTPELPLKNQKNRKYFLAPFLPLFIKIGGHTATNFPGSKVTFSGTFWVFCIIFDHLATVLER